MTSFLNTGSGYQSPEVRALGTITRDSYDYRDQGKTIVKLTNDVSYMAGMMRKMQQGIDSANRSFIQELTGLVTDILVLLGGGGDTGFDFGDLKYVIQAWGALFGFADSEGNIILPLNPFQIAWNFFSNYIGITSDFTELVNQIVDNLIATVLDVFGEVPIVGEALIQLAAIISDIRDLVLPILDAIEELLGAFNLNLGDIGGGIGNFFGPLKPIFDWFQTVLDGFDLPSIVPIVRSILSLTEPFIEWMVSIINDLSNIVRMLTGQPLDGDRSVLFDFLKAIFDVFNMVNFMIHDALTVWTKIVTDIINPMGFFANLVDGFVNILQIPGLDASTIISGTFPLSMITGLIDTGGKIITDLLNIPVTLVNGLLDVGGAIFGSLIPGLHASKITSGTFPQAMIDALPASLAALLPKSWFTAKQTAGTNLATDPEATVPELWIQDGPEFDLELSDEQVVSGTTSVKATRLVTTAAGVSFLRMPSGQRAYGGDNDSVLVVSPGEKYYGECLARVETGVTGSPGRIQFAFFDSTGVNPTQGDGAATGVAPVDSDWTLYSHQATVPAGYDRMAVRWIISSGGSIGDSYYVDRMLIREVTQSQNIIQALFGGTSILSNILTTVVPALDASKITTGTFPQAMVDITEIAANWITGVLDAARIPNLNASKITAGILNILRIPELDASKITTGTFPQAMVDITEIAANWITGVLDSARIPNLDASKITAGILNVLRIPDLNASKIVDGILNVLRIPNLDTSKITTGTFPQSMVTITDIAANLISGVLDAARIPNLNASKITAGILNILRIPELDASKITTGTFPQTMLTITEIASDIISGVLDAANIPNLAASKITSGILNILRIPELDASKITTGTFPQSMVTLTDIAASLISGVLDVARIPNLDASKITAGILNILRIPELDASKITTGTFPQSMVTLTDIAASLISGVLDAARIPNLNASKITAGILNILRIPNLDTSKITTGTFAQSMITGLTSIVNAIFGKKNSGTNLIIDPSFEDPDQWPSGYLNPAYSFSTEQKHSGTQSLKITTIGAGANVLLNGDSRNVSSSSEAALFKVRPGEKYYFEASIFGLSSNTFGTGTAPRIAVEVRDSTGVNSPSTSGMIISPSWANLQSAATAEQWYKISGYLTIPAGYDRMRPYLNCSATEPTGNVWYWDDAIVREVTEPQNIIQTLFGGSSILSSILTTVIPSLDASKITTGTFAQSMVNITSIAANLISGVLATGNIPNLNASKITAGILNALRIPELDTSKITTGTFPQSMVALTDIAANLISGVLDVARIPNLAASKITSGILNVLRIPDLDTSKITTGTFAQAMVNITNIAASIISGVLGTTNIPALDTSKITTGSFNQNRIVNLVSDLTNIEGKADNANDEIVNTQAGIVNNMLPGSGDGVEGVNQAVKALTQTVAGLTQDVHKLQQNQNAESFSGKFFTIDYADYPNGDLISAGVPVDLTYTGPGTGYHAIVNGVSTWIENANGDRYAIGRFTVGKTDTDFQLLQAVAHSPMEVGAEEAFCFRMNDSKTTYGYIKGYRPGLFDFRCELGCYVSGVKTTFITNVPAGFSMNLSVRAGVGTDPYRIQVFSGEDKIIDITDTLHISQIGANYRGAGFFSNTGNNGAASPASAKSVSFSDNAPGAVVGTGIRAYRSSGNIAIAGGYAKFPNDALNQVEYTSSDITWTPTSNCRVTVSKQGFYIVNVTANTAANRDGLAVLYVNGTVARQGGSHPISNRFSNTWVIHLNEGDYIEPALWLGSGTSLVGSADGSSTYFEVAKL